MKAAHVRSHDPIIDPQRLFSGLELRSNGSPISRWIERNEIVQLVQCRIIELSVKKLYREKSRCEQENRWSFIAFNAIQVVLREITTPVDVEFVSVCGEFYEWHAAEVERNED